MAAPREIREWARDQGYAVPQRGQLPADIREAYAMTHPTEEGAAPGADYPTDDDFPGAPTAFGEPPAEPGAAGEEPAAVSVPEQRPVRPSGGRQRAAAPRPGARAATPSKPGGGGLLARLRGGQGKPRAPRKGRVTTENMLAGVWRMGAKLAAPLPPLQRTLRVQAPVAGMLLEDVVRGTVIDTVLQPFARLQGQGRAAGALLGPPVIVTALSLHIAQRASLDPPQEPNPFIMETGLEALRSSLMTWMEVAGPKFEIALQKEREFEERHGQSVDAFINMLFAPPATTRAEAEAEEAALRRAAGYAEAA